MNAKVESLISRANGDPELLVQLVILECSLIIEAANYHKLDPKIFHELFIEEFK